MSTKTFGDVCFEIAQVAKRHRQPTMNYLLEMVALEFCAHPEPLNSKLQAHSILMRVPSIGLWDWDIANDKRYLDDVASSFYGYTKRRTTRGFSPEQLIPKIHRDDVAGWRSKIEKALKSGDKYEHEYRVVSGDRIVWIYSKGQCMTGQSGKPERFSGAMLDITSLKKSIQIEDNFKAA